MGIIIETQSLEKIWNTMEDSIRLSFVLRKAISSIIMKRKLRRKNNDVSRLVVFLRRKIREFLSNCFYFPDKYKICL